EGDGVVAELDVLGAGEDHPPVGEVDVPEVDGPPGGLALASACLEEGDVGHGGEPGLGPGCADGHFPGAELADPLEAATGGARLGGRPFPVLCGGCDPGIERSSPVPVLVRSEEHTSELQSRENLVCRLLLAKKKR